MKRHMLFLYIYIFMARIMGVFIEKSKKNAHCCWLDIFLAVWDNATGKYTEQKWKKFSTDF